MTIRGIRNLAIIGILFGSVALAQNSVDTTVQGIATTAQIWLVFGQRYARDLFLLLAALDFGIFGVMGLINHSDIVSWYAGMVSTFFGLGVMYALLLLGPSLMLSIVDGLMKYAGIVTGMQDGIQLSNIVGDGVDLIQTLLKAGVVAGAHLSTLAMFILIISTFMVGWGFLQLCKAYLMALTESLIVVCVAAIVLGFGALKQTRVYSERYVNAGIGAGVKLMCCYFLVGLEKLLYPGWVRAANGLDFSIFSTQDIKGTLLLVFSIVLFFAIADVNKLAGAIANGVLHFSGHDISAHYMPFANAGISGAIAGATMANRTVMAASGGSGVSGGSGAGSFAIAAVGAEQPAPPPDSGSLAMAEPRRVPPPNGNGRG